MFGFFSSASLRIVRASLEFWSSWVQSCSICCILMVCSVVCFWWFSTSHCFSSSSVFFCVNSPFSHFMLFLANT